MNSNRNQRPDLSAGHKREAKIKARLRQGKPMPLTPPQREQQSNSGRPAAPKDPHVIVDDTQVS